MAFALGCATGAVGIHATRETSSTESSTEPSAGDSTRHDALADPRDLSAALASVKNPVLDLPTTTGRARMAVAEDRGALCAYLEHDLSIDMKCLTTPQVRVLVARGVVLTDGEQSAVYGLAAEQAARVEVWDGAGKLVGRSDTVDARASGQRAFLAILSAPPQCPPPSRSYCVGGIVRAIDPRGNSLADIAIEW